MASCKTEANIEMQQLTDENKVKMESRTEDGAMPSFVISDGRAAIHEPTDGWQIDKKLGECMVQMFDAELWTDVTFICADQSEENLDDRICAHKIVLAARSPVFQAMFFGPLKDISEVIYIQDAEASTFKTFLRSLYSDNVDIVDEFNELTDLLEVFHKYQVQFLVDRCCRKLVENISVENTCALLDRALLYDDQYLIDHVSEFIDRNAEEVLSSDGYLQMSLKGLTYILKGDTFYAKEFDIFNKTTEWAKQRCLSTDGQDIRKTLGDAFYLLRTPVMTYLEFSACTKGKGFYSLGEYESLIETPDHVITCKGELKCSCNKKRYATTLVATRRPGNSGNRTTNGNPTDKISLSLHDEVYLSKVVLINFTDVHHAHTVYYKERGSRYKESIDASTVLPLYNAPLEVYLKIDEVLIPGNYTQTSGDQPSTITLNTPYPLYSGKTYTLQAELCFDVVEEVNLRARLCEKSDSFDCFRNDIISLETLPNNNNAELIQSLCFNCKSNRVTD